MNCPICDSNTGRCFEAREMMLGLNHHFTYFECGHCNSLHLVNPPEDMGDYYPSDIYYSYNQNVTTNSSSSDTSLTMSLRSRILRQRNEAQLFDKGGPSRWLSRIRPHLAIDRYKKYVSHCGKSSFEMRILDVGCGNGSLLQRFAQLGFRNLEGIDPYFNKSDNNTSSIVRIRPLTLEEMKGESFDLIIFNHSLEHMPHQIESLFLAKQLLTPSGCCRVEIPIADSLAYQRYTENWVELDAPRHYCLHTVQSLTMAAAKAGLQIVEVAYAGTTFEFWGSELYCRNLTLVDKNTGQLRDPLSVFTDDEMQRFEDYALEANEKKKGGRAIFHLKTID